MVFIARRRSPISSWARASTTWVRSPAPISCASFTERLRPREIEIAIQAAAAAPTAMAPSTIAIRVVRVDS